MTHANSRITTDNAISRRMAVCRGTVEYDVSLSSCTHLTPSTTCMAPKIAQMPFKMARAKISAVFWYTVASNTMPRNHTWKLMNAMFSHLILPNRYAALSGIMSSLVIFDNNTLEDAGSGNRLACSVFCEHISACKAMIMTACNVAVAMYIFDQRVSVMRVIYYCWPFSFPAVTEAAKAKEGIITILLTVTMANSNIPVKQTSCLNDEKTVKDWKRKRERGKVE